jgi:hypothetical protein
MTSSAVSAGVASSSRYSSRSLFFAFALIFLMLIPPGIIVVDGISMFSTADALAKGPHLYVACSVSGYNARPGMAANIAAVIGRGGHCYSLWYPLLPLLAAPFTALGELIGSIAGARSQNVAEVFALIVPALATAGAAALTAMLAGKLGASRRAAVAAAVAFAFGTEALTYSRTFFAEPLAALLIAVAVWGLTETGRRRRWAYVAIGLSVLAKPELVLVGPVLAGLLALRQRNVRAAVAPLLATGAGIVAYLLYNWIRFADVLRVGGDTHVFRPHNFVDPAAIARAAGLYLLSPGMGMLWFSPVAAVGAFLLWRRRRNPTAALAIGASLAVAVIYIGHYDPSAGVAWGDRYLLPTMPMLCAALATAPVRVARLASVLVVLTLISQVPTTLAFYDRTYAEHNDQRVDLTAHRWSVADSPLVGAWPAMVHQLRDAAHSNVRKLARHSTGVPHTELQYVIALWWWLLPVVGIPWWLGAMFAVGVMGAGAMLLARGAGLFGRAPPGRDTGGGFAGDEVDERLAAVDAIPDAAAGHPAGARSR